MYRFMFPTWPEDEGPVQVSVIGIVVGDKIWVGRTVAILFFEDAKATAGIESPVNGIVEQICATEWDYLSSGQLFMLVQTEITPT